MHPNAWIIYSVIINVYYQFHQVNSQCSGSPKTIEVGYKTGYFNYPESGEYDTNQTCEWLLTSTVSGAILFKSTNIGIDCSDSYNIYDGQNSSSPAKETGICTTGSPSSKHLNRSIGQHLFLTFKSDEKSTPLKDIGFAIYFVSSPDRSSCLKSGSTTVLIASNTTQAFTSPLFPNTYPGNHKCSWTILPSTPDGTVILTLSYIDIDFYNNKCFDKLTINYGTFQNETEEVCGDENFSPNKSYTNGGNGNITVTFTRDDIQVESGFVAVYTEIVSDTTVPPTETPITEPPTTESTTTELTKIESSTTRLHVTTTESSSTRSTTTDLSTTLSAITEPSTTHSTTGEPLTTSSTPSDSSTIQSSPAYSTTKEPSTIVSSTTDISTTESETTGHQTTESTTTQYLTTKSTTSKPLTTELTKPDPPATGISKADNVLQIEPFVATISLMYLIVLIPIIIYTYFWYGGMQIKHDRSRPDFSYELNDMSSVPSWRVSYTPKLYNSWTYGRGHSKIRSDGVMTANEYNFPEMEVEP